MKQLKTSLGLRLDIHGGLLRPGAHHHPLICLAGRSPSSVAIGSGSNQRSARAQAAPAARPPGAVLTVAVERPRRRGGPVLGLEAGWGAAGGRYPRLGHDDSARRGWQGMVGVCDSAKLRAERRLLEAEGRNHQLRTEARREGGASCPRHGAAFFPARERPRVGLGADARESDRWGRELRAGRRQPTERGERPQPEVPVSR